MPPFWNAQLAMVTLTTGRTEVISSHKRRIQHYSLCHDKEERTYAKDTRTRNRYRKLVPENQFSGTSFSYQMKLEAKFLD